ncbi:MAG TPA: PH domain-containing protein [Burkholderiales bacterium]|nr:PH domain-containing protein [Burkholderiales bacterium]
MAYESRPTWRYQWSAVALIVTMLVVVTLVQVYGPVHLGTRLAHLAIAAAGAIALYSLLLGIYRRFSWRYLIDEHNIESYHGILARRVHSIRLGDLRNINVDQTVMQRLLGVGDVEFSSAAGGEVEVVFFGVADPMAVKVLVQRLQGDTAIAE